MNTRKLILAGTVMAVGILALASIGFAAAQTGDTPNGAGAHGTMAGHGQMGDHTGMTGQHSMRGTGDVPGQNAERQATMREAAATALGITVDELNSELAAGKTVADIAAAKGVDLATVQAAMHAANPAGQAAGPEIGRMTDCPQQS